MKTFIGSLIVFLFLFQGVYSQCPAGYSSVGSEHVTNGGFESGNTGFTSEYTYVSDKAWSQSELNPEGYYSVWDDPNDLHSNFSSCSGIGGSGNLMIINGATVEDEEVWSQTISVTANTMYYFTVWVASVHPDNPAELQFSVNGTNLDVPFNASNRTCDWNQFYATWNSGANTSADISVVNKNTIPNGNDFALDYVSFMECELDILPVTLSEFNASIDEDKESVELKWTTLTEVNNDYFTLLKSEDGLDFYEIARVKGSGNSNELLEYSYVDNSPADEEAYYMLKQTDFDGNFELSDIIVYSKTEDGSSCEFKVIPNPCIGNCKFVLNDCVEMNGKMTFSIFDALGNKVETTLPVELTNGNLQYEFSNSNNLRPGLFIIRAGNDINNKIERVIIK